jgi:hypothetical protein
MTRLPWDAPPEVGGAPGHRAGRLGPRPEADRRAQGDRPRSAAAAFVGGVIAHVRAVRGSPTPGSAFDLRSILDDGASVRATVSARGSGRPCPRPPPSQGVSASAWARCVPPSGWVFQYGARRSGRRARSARFCAAYQDGTLKCPRRNRSKASRGGREPRAGSCAGNRVDDGSGPGSARTACSLRERRPSAIDAEANGDASGRVPRSAGGRRDGRSAGSARNASVEDTGPTVLVARCPRAAPDSAVARSRPGRRSTSRPAPRGRGPRRPGRGGLGDRRDAPGRKTPTQP